MKKVVPILVALMPVFVFAQTQKTEALLGRVGDIVQTIIGIAFMLAFLFFVWGIATFVKQAGDPAGREEGRQRMIWGVIALAVLATVWGIVQWLQGEFGLSGGGPADLLRQFKLDGGGS